jgi:hypothetical protein
MFDVRYLGLRLVSSRAAMREMMFYGMSILDCKDILEEGYSPRKRAADTVERWLDVGSKTYNAVVVRLYNGFFGEYVWLITHVGRFTRR